jgi:hypothetical protein
LTLVEDQAVRLGLPILGAEGPPAAESGGPAPSPTGWTFLVSAAAGTDATVYASRSDGGYDTLTIRPGVSYTLPSRASTQFCYLDGNPAAPTRWQALELGSYEFRRTPQGAWSLVRPTYSVTVDNSANAQPFVCRVDGRTETIPPRGSAQLRATSPSTVVEFARGNRETASRLLLSSKSRYAVRADADSQGLDLFESAAEEPLEPALADAGAGARPSSISRGAERPVAPIDDADLRARYPVGELPR